MRTIHVSALASISKQISTGWHVARTQGFRYDSSEEIFPLKTGGFGECHSDTCAALESSPTENPVFWQYLIRYWFWWESRQDWQFACMCRLSLVYTRWKSGRLNVSSSWLQEKCEPPRYLDLRPIPLLRRTLTSLVCANPSSAVPHFHHPS